MCTNPTGASAHTRVQFIHLRRAELLTIVIAAVDLQVTRAII